MNKGVFCISIDTELMWGRKDLPNADYFVPRIKKEREIIKRLLVLFGKYQVPVTWAVVGKLREESSGREIYEMIAKEKMHEMGSHSYTHPEFTKIDRNKAEYEFKKSAGSYSFVFPRNKIKYLDLLKKNGFKAFRGADRRAWELLYPGLPPVYEPTLESEVVNIPGSMYFVSARGMKRFIPKGLRLIKTRLGITRATSEKGIFHLWFHPIDFADSTDALFNEFESILKYASQKRDQRTLEILTMKQITLKWLGGKHQHL